MIKTGGYIKLFFYSLTVALLLSNITEVKSQCGATSGTGLFDPIENNFCGGEKQVWVGKRFSSVDVPPGDDVYVQVDWGYPGAVEYYPTILNAGNYELNTGNTVSPVGLTAFPDDRYAYHLYPQDLPDCEYNVNVSIVFVDGGEDPETHPSAVVCNSSTNTLPTVYWERDSEIPGSLDIQRSPEITICEGQSVTINPLENLTTYNCPLSNNTSERWFQWVYNTDGTNPIPDVTIDGDNITTEDFNVFPSGYTNPDFQEVVQLDPGPNNGAGDLDMDPTGEITIDGTNTAVGQTFDITLRAWNTCNPFDDPDIPGNPLLNDAANADFPPEEFTITIRVVAAPNPNPEVQDPNDATNWFDNTDPITEFCAGEPVNFRQLTATGDDNFAWDFDWDGVESNFNVQSTQQNPNFIYDGTYIGSTVTVGLRITRGNIGEPCVFYETIQIDIIDTPQATISTDGDDTIESLAYCQEDLPVDLTFTDVTTGKNNQTTTQWEIFDIDNNDITPTGSLIQPNSNTTYNPAELSPYTITDGMGPGRYRVVLSILDGGTSCSTSDTVDIFIYDTPEADFETDDVCEGDDDPSNRTLFFNIADATNGINPQVNGDEIVRWMWDFSFDAVAGFNIERDVNNNNDFNRFLDGTDGAAEPIESQPGSYDVALVVETTNGCTDTIQYVVEVKHNPLSDLNATYTNDYEGNSAGDSYTGDPICPGTLLTFTNITDESLNDPSVAPVDYELQIDSLGTTIFREIGAPGDANEFVSPNIFFNNTGSNEIYTIELVANGDNGCSVISNPITVTVLPGSASGFDVYDEPTFTDLYDPLVDYCSPYEFYFQIDNPTDNLLNPGDSLVWEVFDGSTLLGGDTLEFGDLDYDKFSFEFNNDFPSIAAINYTVVLQPFVDGVCVNNSQRTVRVLPKPISDFTPSDTVVTCDSVTYYFEAEQPGLLTYDWQVLPTADTLSTQNDGVDFWVSYARPDVGDPIVNVEVVLETTNPFGCPSDISDPFNDTIQPKDDIDIVLDIVGNQFCAPTSFGFVNNTTDPVPAGTEWELIISNLDNGSTTIVDGNTISGNEDFRKSAPGDIFEYEFTDSANYEIRLNALLPSTCDVASDPPISLAINETPEVNFNYITDNANNCAPLEVRLIETSTIPSGSDFFLHYEITDTTNNTTYFNSTPVLGSGGHLNGEILPVLTNTTQRFIDYEIKLIAESLSGCVDDSAMVVRVFQEPEIDFDVISPNPSCEDYNIEFEVTANNIPDGDYELTWNWGDGQTLVTREDTIVNHTFSNRASFFGSDSYTVSLSIETDDGCTETVFEPVNLNPRVQAGFFKDKEQGCSPLPVNFTSTSIQAGISGNHQYEKRVAGTSTWVPFDNSPSNTGAVAETFSNTSDSVQIIEIRYNVFSDISNGTICYDTAQIDSLTVFPEFNSPAITGPNEICAFAQQVPFTVDSVPGSNYQWTLPPGAFISGSTTNGDSVNVNFSSFSGDMQVIEIDSNGCFGEPTLFPVSILTGPSGTLSLNGSNVICPGDSTSLIFNLTGPGSQNFDVVYNNGVENDTLLNIASGHIEYVSPSVSTNYFLLSVKDREYPACNPSAINGSAFVSVNVKPTATLSGSTTICEGNTTNLFFNLTGIGPWEVIYTDGNSNFTINTNNPFTLDPVSPSDSTTYSLVSVTDGNTPVCSGDVSGSATIEVNQKPTAEIFGSQTNLCVNTPTEIGINLTGTPPWNVRYTDGNNIFTAANITPSGSFDVDNDTYTHTITFSAAPGTKDYTLVDVLDSNTPSCSGDVSGIATITAFDRPEASIEGTNTICLGESSPLTFSFVGDGPFDVLLTANQDTLEYNNLQNGQSINLAPELSTVYRIIELTDTRGCVGNSLGGPISINVNNLPSSSLSGDDVTCYGEETELTFDQSGVGPWTITYTDGSQNFTFTTSFNRHFEPVFPTSTTTYSLVSVVDSNSPDNCSGTVSGSAEKEVFPQLVASFEASPETMVLPDRTVEITNNTTNKNEWEYEWDFGDGTISNEVDPADHEYATYGEYVIRMTATNGQCTDTYQTVITIGAIPPIVDFDATPKEGCLPLVVTFENLTQFADPSTYQWEFGDGQRVSAVENPTHVYRNPGTYTVRLTASNITGQRTEMLKEEFITVFATPQASFTIPDEYRQVFTGEEVRFVNLSEGADEYIWKFGDGNESFEFEPIHAYPDSGVYDITLIAINSETGCTDSVSLSSQVKVILGGESDVPNAFTPSRAGPGTASTNPLQNDFFLPRVEGVSQFNMKIYNRWGELLFESTDKNIGWDGYYNGVLMPQGVYVYRLELVYENGRRETKVGDITLIR